MMLEIFFALLVGVLAGTFTGLVPSLHVNLVGVLLLSFVGFFDPLLLVVFVVSLSLTHTFVDVIPSTFFGVPDEDTVLSVLPAHRFLLFGKGFFAVVLFTLGSFLSLLLFLFLVPFFSFVFPFVLPFVERFIDWFLFNIVVLLFLFESGNVVASFFVFVLSGFLGVITLNLSVDHVLLPLLSGLFGSSSLLFSLHGRVVPPPQTLSCDRVSLKSLFRPVLATFVASPLCAFFPGLGSSQASVIGSRLSGSFSRSQFLVLLGSVNTLVMSSSFLFVLLLGRTRTGAALVFSDLLGLGGFDVSLSFLAILVLCVGVLASVVTLVLARFVALRIHRFDYSFLSWCILFFVSVMVVVFSGWLGFFVFLVSTLLGLWCFILGVRRSFLMGCLLIPSLLLFLF